MKTIFVLVALVTFSSSLSVAQNPTTPLMPEYVNSVTAWNSTLKVGVALTPEDGQASTKMSATNFVPGANLFAKTKRVMKFHGAKSSARITITDTLKFYVQIEPNLNPAGYFKIFKANIKGDEREVVGATSTAMKGSQRNDGDYQYTIKKVSPGIFQLDVVDVHKGDEIAFYIGTHEKKVAVATLGID